MAGAAELSQCSYRNRQISSKVTMDIIKWTQEGQIRRIREAPPQKKRENVGIFPKWGTPPPLPPVWEWHVCEKKIMVYFAFQDLRNIFGFHKNVHFWVVLWFVEVGTGDPTPPLKRKIPTLSRFVIFFLQNEHSGTQNKINLKWSNWSDNTSPLL